jgi:hypothetical protein
MIYDLEGNAHEQEKIVDLARHGFGSYKPRKPCVSSVELVSN